MELRRLRRWAEEKERSFCSHRVTDDDVTACLASVNEKWTGSDVLYELSATSATCKIMQRHSSDVCFSQNLSNNISRFHFSLSHSHSIYQSIYLYGSLYFLNSIHISFSFQFLRHYSILSL